MKRIIKNLGPYRRTVFAILILLVVQAFCDLSLPQYTSEMIDTGLQNRGIEHVLPQKATPDTYAMTMKYMTEKESQHWRSSFSKKGDLYIRKTFSKEELENADELLMMPLAMAFSSLRTGKIASRSEMENSASKLGDRMTLSMAKAYTAAAEKQAGMDMDKMQMQYLYRKGGQLFIMACLMFISAVLIAYAASKVSAGVGRDMRLSVFKNVMEYSGSEMDRFSTASLITRSTNDVQQIQMVTAVMLRVVLYAPIIAIGGIFKLILQRLKHVGFLYT